MKWMKAFFSLSIALLIIFCGVVFTINNPAAVQPDLIVWKAPELSLGVMLTVTLLVGCMLGILANTIWTWRILRQRNRLQKQLDLSQKRFEQLQ
jgi:uncharacterized integral membrane protein